MLLAEWPLMVSRPKRVFGTVLVGSFELLPRPIWFLVESSLTHNCCRDPMWSIGQFGCAPWSPICDPFMFGSSLCARGMDRDSIESSRLGFGLVNHPECELWLYLFTYDLY